MIGAVEECVIKFVIKSVFDEVANILSIFVVELYYETSNPLLTDGRSEIGKGIYNKKVYYIPRFKGKVKFTV